ncbi:hypothetical protein CEXT_24021, partial [Caerostris extrusa]
IDTDFTTFDKIIFE